MDDPSLPAADHDAALAGLARINRWSAVGAILWPEVRRRAPADVLDIGSGGGDVLFGLARRARRDGLAMRWTGSDLSAHAVARANRLAAGTDLPIRFRCLDALRHPLPPHDVVLSTLMLHHLDEAPALELLRAMNVAARERVLICDLDRSAAGLALAWFGTRLLTRSPVVHVDGVRSVRAAFRRDEVRALAHEAGLRDVTVRRHWPCRWLLSAAPS